MKVLESLGVFRTLGCLVIGAAVFAVPEYADADGFTDNYSVDYVRVQDGWARVVLLGEDVDPGVTCDVDDNVFVIQEATHGGYDNVIATALMAMALGKEVQIFSNGCLSSPSYPNIYIINIFH